MKQAILKGVGYGVFFWACAQILVNLAYILNPWVPNHAQMTDYTREVLQALSK